jgi:hypothetical protein
MRAAALIVLVGILASAGCAGADHDALASRDAATGGSAGAGGSIVDAADQEGDVVVLDGGADADGTESGGDAELQLDSSFGPDGPSVFTFVHGLSDAREIRVCFHVDVGGHFAALDVPPLPDDPVGLPFAESFSGSTLPGNIDLAATDVRPVVYVGALDEIVGRSCVELTAQWENVHPFTLAVIPAGTLAKQRSVLMVVAGCVGGLEHVDAYQEAVCGTGYASDKPSVRLLLASVDRTTQASAIGLQVFIGSLAPGAVSVDHLVAMPSKTTTLASGVMSGVLEPRPPSFALSKSDLGTDLGANSFRVFVDQATEPGVIAYLPDALARGGLGLNDFVDGANFTVVLVGPRADVPAGTWWNSPAFTVVRSAP